MASFISFLTDKKVPSLKKFRALLRGPFTTLRIVVYSLIIAVCGVIFAILIILNNRILVTVPAHGGNLTEGIIGAPHFINPIIAATEPDLRLTALLFSPLSTDMQSYTVSPDGKTYTIALLPHLRFDDKKPLTSDDVAFTVEKLQDSTLSNQSNYWQTISVDTPDANTVVFTLPAPDTSFLNHLNFGILPKHIWQNISDQSFADAAQNMRPVGEGPFKLSDIEYTDGIPSTIVLVRNPFAPGGAPLLHTITIDMFSNQSSLMDALNSGTIDFSYDNTPDALANTPMTNDDMTIQSIPTNETVSIYRSPSDTALTSGTIVMQLNQIIDKNSLIAIVQHGYGTPAGNAPAPTQNVHSSFAGFSLAVENDPQLLLAAQTIAQQLQQAGITVVVKAYDQGTFQENVMNGTFTLFLASNAISIPQQYNAVLPLYTISVPYIFDSHSHTMPPATLDSPITEYGNAKDWYTNTNKLWKWFIRKN